MSIQNEVEIKVEPEVLEGLEAVRDSGEYNMFDWNGVRGWLSDNEYEAAYDWVTEHKKEYAEGIFKGFVS